MPAPVYRHLVEIDGPGVTRGRLYDGTDAADAMAAWSKAVSDGNEYVTLESLIAAGSPLPPPRCDYGKAGPGSQCPELSVWLETWQCTDGHLVYRRLCDGHDPGLPADIRASGAACGFRTGTGTCTRPATMISRTRPQR
jgi:hypothetical protein